VAAPVTLSEVAAAAGVSPATASRVLNGSTRSVSAALRLRVLTAAARLNYSPNAAAQAMVRGHVDVVGVVVRDIADPYFGSIAAGVIRRAEQAGLLVAISSTGNRPDREADHLAGFRRQRARAVILVGSRTTDEAERDRLRAEVENMRATGARVAAISQRRLPVDTVVIENRAGSRALAESLVALGYRRFGVLAGPGSLLTARDRLAGFRVGLARHGLDVAPGHMVTSDFTRDGGYAAMERLLEVRKDVHCVFAVNDVMAVGAMAALRDHGVPLPGEIAVAGFDDIATLRDVTPHLTTVRVDLERLGELVLELVLDPEQPAPRTHRARGEVVLRDSTPPLT
jgi:LacI family transcriptional regulator